MDEPREIYEVPQPLVSTLIPLMIVGHGGTVIFQINADGSVTGEKAKASEAAAIFAKSYIDILNEREQCLCGAITGAPADPEAFA